MKVLIADDSAEIRKRLSNMILNIQKVDLIEQADNVEEAIQIIQNSKPDVVILDIQMSGGNGIDVLSTITKKNNYPVVIMLTNYPYPQYRDLCFEYGADFFFDKSDEFEKVSEIFLHISLTSIQKNKKDKNIKGEDIYDGKINDKYERTKISMDETEN
ncbi:MAG: response regulator transcription factor [Nitrospirae bacterium]|nr:response regulator transcription factor [Nitrospirota bacterium]